MRYFLLIVLLFCSLGLVAQDTELWLHTGVSMNAYKGDLSSYDQYTSAFHVGAQLNRKLRVNGNVNIGFGFINGENRNFTFESEQLPLPSPNRFFKTTFFYVNYDLHYNIIKKKNIIVYLSQGIGVMRFTPEDDDGNNLSEQQATREDGETYRKETLMLPTNIGAIYLFPNQFGISVQAGLYNTLTDYLDNISNLGDSKKDNILAFRFAFFVPVKYKDE